MKWTTERRKVSDLIPYEYNPRQMTEKQNKDLTASLKKFDLVEIPAINTDGVILAGHQRLRIMQALGRGNEEIDVRVPDRLLTEKEVQEYNIRSNKNVGEFDFDVLANAFEATDLLEWGFDEKDLRIETPEVDEDEVPELPEEPTTKLGDLFQLGNHRLLCGDATKVEDVERLLDGKKADMVFTDPPYFIGLTSTGLTISQADKSNILHFFVAWMTTLAKSSIGHWYICTDWRTFPVIQEAAVTYLGRMTNLIVWDFEWIKAGGQYRFTHELIMFGDRENGRKVPRDEPDVWRLQATNFTTERLHGAQKPSDLMGRAIKNSSLDGEIVLDFFGGSGSTLIACEQLNRSCYMMELDPKYCDVIVKRWENLTGEKAVKL